MTADLLPEPARRLATAPALHPRLSRWKVGLIVLATDHTSERDFFRMNAGTDMEIHVTRVPYANPTTPENLRRMLPLLTDAARLILPDETLDAVAYSCTSASVEIGDDAVRAAIQAGKPGVPVITPASAGLAAFAALGVKRVSVLAPYTPDVAGNISRYFAANGLAVGSTGCFGLDDDRLMARLTPDALIEAAAEIIDPDAEGLFISCTALRSAELVEAIEARIGRPVVTSNQAQVWQVRHVLGVPDALPGYGRLLRLAEATHA